MRHWDLDSETLATSITSSTDERKGMKVCIACGAHFSGSGWECPLCHQVPKRISGNLTFLPEWAEKSDGFEARHYESLAPMEADYFWFCSRKNLILWVIHRYFQNAEKFFEVGCGTGLILSSLKTAFPDLLLSGSEIYGSALRYTRERLKKADVDLYQMDARFLPFENEFDIVGAFDVLEHITEDELALSQMYKAVSPGGGVILTVPQHPFLWGPWDEISCHKRRYTKKDLLDKVEAAGFRILWMTSFFTLLFPVLVVWRLWQGRGRHAMRQPEVGRHFYLPRVLNSLSERVCDVERGLLKRGLSLPLGGSLLCLGIKE